MDGGGGFGGGSGSLGGGFGMDDDRDEGGGGGGSRNRRGNRGRRRGSGASTAYWGPEIEGFEEALLEAFTVAGVNAVEPDAEIRATIGKIMNVGNDNSQKFSRDDRASQRMSAAHAKAFVGEFIETVMTGLSNFLYEKSWFEKLSWNGPLLMLTQHTFSSGKIFTRILQTDVLQVVDEGLLAWSEEERIVKVVWASLDSAGVQGKHRKTASKAMREAYDDAFFSSPFGSSMHHGGTPEQITIMDFVKGWMTAFIARGGANVLQNGIPDTSFNGQISSLAIIFATLMDPSSPCLPIHLQPSLPAAPWWYINQCSCEVMGGAGGGAGSPGGYGPAAKRWKAG